MLNITLRSIQCCAFLSNKNFQITQNFGTGVFIHKYSKIIQKGMILKERRTRSRIPSIIDKFQKVQRSPTKISWCSFGKLMFPQASDQVALQISEQLDAMVVKFESS